MNISIYKGSRGCPVCNCNIKHGLFSVKMSMPSDCSLPEEYKVAQCVYCGCCYADTRATAADYDDYYKTSNYYGEMDIEISAYKQLYEITINELHRLGIKKEKMVDIGFGKGELCVALKENGFDNICGIDPSPASVEHLRKQGIECGLGSAYDYVSEPEKKRYKAIFMYGVIEHLYDPGLAIERVKDYLEEDGCLFLWVPVFDHMEEDLTPVVNNFNGEHINYFSEISLDNLAGVNGLKKLSSHLLVSAELEDSKEYGVLAVYRMTADEQISDLGKDNVTAESVCGYYSRVMESSGVTRTMIKELCDSKEEIVIWGTGAYMKNLWATTDLNKCNVSGFIDNNAAKTGQQIFERNIYSPDYILNGYQGKIVVCCMMYSEEIKKQIVGMGKGLISRVLVL